MSISDASRPPPIRPCFTPSVSDEESPDCRQILSTLNMQPHVEGGYFVETDRDPCEVPNPFLNKDGEHENDEGLKRNASTSIFYYLTPLNSQGNFHRNKARTVHTLHKGRGQYVIIHADDAQSGCKPRVETFIVGQDVEKGEKLQWVVEGGKYKASFLLPDKDCNGSQGLLISETVVPGFDYRDHDFLRERTFRELVTPDQAEALKWLLRFE